MRRARTQGTGRTLRQRLGRGLAFLLAVAIAAPAASLWAPQAAQAATYPELTISVVASSTTLPPAGQPLTFTFTVKNAGQATVSDIQVFHFGFVDAPQPSGCATTLEPAYVDPVTSAVTPTSFTCQATWIVTAAAAAAGSISSLARVSATVNGANVTIDAPGSSITVLPKEPVVSLDVAKTASPQTVTYAGQQVTYTVKVTNNGNVTMTGLTLEDETDGTGTMAPRSTSGCNASFASSLAPGASKTCYYVYTVAESDLDEAHVIHNAATVTGHYNGGEAPITTSSTGRANVAASPPINRQPQLQVTKTANSINAYGDYFVFNITVKNTGNVTLEQVVMEELGLKVKSTGAPRTLVDASDPTCSGKFPSDTSHPENMLTLVPGASASCKYTYKPTLQEMMAGGGVLVNNVYAHGRYERGPAGYTFVEDYDSVEVTVPAVQPKLKVTKTVTPSNVTYLGQQVNYTVKVQNNGNVDVSNIAFDDVFTGLGTLQDKAGANKCSDMPASLTVGQIYTCYYTYFVTQADLDNSRKYFDNTATATGDSYGVPAEGTSTARVTVNKSTACDMRVAKTLTSNPSGAEITVGDAMEWTITVENKGGATIENISLTEQFGGTGQLQPGTPACPTDPFTLMPGEKMTCKVRYTVTEADAESGVITNYIRATSGNGTCSGSGGGTFGGGTGIAQPRPGLAIYKTATPSTGDKAGRVINYEVRVVNTGNVPVNDVTVADSFYPQEGFTLPNDTDPAVPCQWSGVNLAKGESKTCTYTYTLTDQDIEQGTHKIYNTVQAHGTWVKESGNQAVSSLPVTRIVTVESANPALEVTKTADWFGKISGWDLAANQPVTFTIKVKNTGSVTLTSVKLTDVWTGNLTGSSLEPGLENSCTDLFPKGSLAPDEEVTCTMRYRVNIADLTNHDYTATNTVTASTEYKTIPVSDTASVEVPFPARNPHLTVEKSASRATVSWAGQEIVYSILVVNDGNLPLSNVTIDDQLSGAMGSLQDGETSCSSVFPANLEPNASLACDYVYRVGMDDYYNGVHPSTHVSLGNIITNTVTATG
ncbi:MAG: DUF11 domain-containing protein, partial [Propionibacteriaceae bacterium]|nr:DUF11 domain-containing protein [Propionibacteriaceae bacterium]